MWAVATLKEEEEDEKKRRRYSELLRESLNKSHVKSLNG
jgi:hypothetical protein